MASDNEFTEINKLEKLSDEQLEQIVLHGNNLHIHTSKASVAKRVLDNRRQRKHLEAAENVEKVTKQLEKSHAELMNIVGGLVEVVQLLSFLKNHWFPKQSILIRIILFILGTVVLGIALNLAADWIAKFIFRW